MSYRIDAKSLGVVLPALLREDKSAVDMLTVVALRVVELGEDEQGAKSVIGGFMSQGDAPE